MNCSLPLAAMHFGLKNTVQGNAFADLSVTGRRAFSAFRQGQPAENYCQTIANRTLPAACPAPSPKPTPAQMVAGCKDALNRGL